MADLILGILDTVIRKRQSLPFELSGEEEEDKYQINKYVFKGKTQDHRKL